MKQLKNDLINKQKEKDVIGSYFRKLRYDIGLLQEDVAHETGLDVKTISRYENGETSFRGKAIYKLAKFYGLTIDKIIEDINSEIKLIIESNLNSEENKENLFDIMASVIFIPTLIIFYLSFYMLSKDETVKPIKMYRNNLRYKILLCFIVGVELFIDFMLFFGYKTSNFKLIFLIFLVIRFSVRFFATIHFIYLKRKKVNCVDFIV